MEIARIEATPREIRFFLREAVEKETLHIAAFPAAVWEEGELFSISLTAVGDSFSVGRYLSGKDGISYRYVISGEMGEVGGKRYVERLTDAPMPRRLCGVGRIVSTPAEGQKATGTDAAALFLNMGDLLLPYPGGEETVLYSFGGREYYIRKEAIDYVSAILAPLQKAGVPVTLLLVNAKEWLFDTTERFWQTLCCPGTPKEASYAMFPVTNEEGMGYFAATVAFLAERFRPFGMGIGYDVNDPAYAAMGEGELIPCAEVYTTALRVAYQTAAPFGVQIFAAVDGCLLEARPGAFAAGEFLTAIRAFAKAEGEIPFGVFAHPKRGDRDYIIRLAEGLSHEDMFTDGVRRPLALGEISRQDVPSNMETLVFETEE